MIIIIIILSHEGPHQGDPLGPLLFCLSIGLHLHLVQMKSELVAGFMDDLTLGGPTDVIAADIDLIRDGQNLIGLHINAAKCEIISRLPAPQASQFSKFIFLEPEEAELLEAPLFTGSNTDAVLSSRCAELNTAINRLSLLSAHDALILFRASFSAPKLMHTLRCAPCVTHPSLEHIDSMLRKGVCAITNLDLTDL